MQMNKELKEILENIKNKYEDYYVQDIVSNNDLKQLLDYITDLQERLDFMIDRNDEKQDRIDKAREYIASQKIIFKDYDIVVDNQLKNILEILDKEKK